MEHERTPPAAIDAEACVLGSMILRGAVIPQVEELLTKDDFYRPAHQELFWIICDMARQGSVVDLVTLRNELVRLKKLEALGGIEYLEELVQVPNYASMPHYAKIVKDRAVKRAVIIEGTQIVQEAYDGTGTAGELIEAWQSKAFTLDQEAGAVVDVQALTEGMMERAVTREQGLALGCQSLDFATGGLRPGNYMILAGQAKTGKTTVMLNWVRGICERRKRVLLISREMHRNELVDRMACSLVSINALKVRNGHCNKAELEELRQAKSMMDKWALRVDSQSSTLAQIDTQLRRFGYEIGKPDLLVIDYFQLLRGPGRSRYEMFSDISAGIKAMLGRHEIPGIILSQYRRPPEGQQDKRPHIGQLKETGALENDADAILLMWLPYGIEAGDTTRIWGALTNRHGPAVDWPQLCPPGSEIEFKWTLACSRIESSDYSSGVAPQGDKQA